MTIDVNEILASLPEDRRKEIEERVITLSSEVKEQEKINKLIILNTKLQGIIENAPHRMFGDIDDNVAWELSKEYFFERLYKHVFSEKCSKWVHNNFPSFDYYDPDTSYQEDVMAFVTNLNEYVKHKFSNFIFENIDEYFHIVIDGR